MSAEDGRDQDNGLMTERLADGTVRIRFRNWKVDVRADGVHIPDQAVLPGQAVADLATCLAAAGSLLSANRPSQPSRQRLPTCAPATPEEGNIAEVYRCARELVQARWCARNYTVYHATRDAWVELGMTVPYTAVMGGLRAQVPEGLSLSDVNDELGQDAVLELYARAIRASGPVGSCTRRRTVA